jgi:hypothetical protein
MIDKKIFRYLLSTDGVNQLERSAFALDPDSVKVDGRSKQDIVRFLLALSEQIRYYNSSNTPQGDWQLFLRDLTDGNEILEDVEIDALYQVQKNCPPHLALLLAFLKVYPFLQEDINQLTARRLNFYYEDALRILRRPAVGDQVHTIFELSKNGAPVKLAQGTTLTAGTTGNGTPLLYQLDSEYIITQAQIAMISSDFVDHNLSGSPIIYKADTAANVPGVGSGWRPFGLPQFKVPAEESFMTPALLGCAIASPDFKLAEGTRQITIELTLTSMTDVADMSLASALIIEMTTEAGWTAPNKIHQARLSKISGGINEQKVYQLFILIEFTETAPAITAYQELIHLKRLNTSWPVWRMSLKPTAFQLERLNTLAVAAVKTTVDVKGIRNLIVQNDQSIQSANAPVFPFGNAPHIGSNFYIGSTEAFSKSITSFAINLQWQDVPESLQTHYAAYENPNVTDAEFQGDIFLLGGKDWHIVNGAKLTLFDTAGNDQLKSIFIESLLGNVVATSGYQRKPTLTLGNAYTQSSQQGFVRLVLTNPTKSDLGILPIYAPFEAFGHKAFPYVYADHAIRIAKEEVGVVLPQPPYTPVLSSITLDYTAVNTFVLSAPNQVDQFFSLDVFGCAESQEGTAIKLIPFEPHQGAMYLGLQNAQPSQIISMLFQMEEGSTPGSTLLESENINWRYLSGNEWKQISRADILEDKTQGLQVPGLIRVVLGPDATTAHTLMPAGLHWLRASIDSNTDGAADVLAIHAQAARASLLLSADSPDSYDEHLSSPLSPETIKSLSQKIPTIKKIYQYYPSFGGRPSESDREYHRRTHERLRHRSRAVSQWDYERIVLENFPEIFKVKSLPHTDIENNLAPGHVKLVLVPDWRKRPSGNPLQPKANGALMKSIETFIKENHCSTFTSIHVTNPVYETLLVDCNVAFMDGFDPGFYALQLEEEIKRFLSPWAYEEGEDIVFGGKIYASEIMAFIEGREYIDYLTDFALYHRYKGTLPGGISEMQIDVDFIIGTTPEPTIGIDEDGKIIGNDFIVGVPVDAAIATLPDAILVSSDTHRIGVIADHGCEGTQQIGIGQMIIGLDFIVVS